jgi:hypothetical protein
MQAPSALLAKGILVSSFSPSLDLPPWLRSKKPVHLACRQHSGATRFAVTVMKMGQPRQKPHRKKWNRRPKCPPRFGDETAATRSKDAIHFRHRAPAVRQNGEKSRRDQNVK